MSEQEEIYQRRGKYHFSPSEIADLKDGLVANTNAITAYNKRIDEHKDAIKDLRSNAASMAALNKEDARKVEDGYENKMLPCTRIKNWGTSEWVFYCVDTGDEVTREPFTRDDYQVEIGDEGPNGDSDDDLKFLGRDALFEEAAYLLMAKNGGGASLLQQELNIGYNRAGRILDQLESAGICGPFNGSSEREILIENLVALSELLENLSTSTVEEE